VDNNDNCSPNNDENKNEVITQEQLTEYAESIGLFPFALGRISWFFILNVYLLERFDSIEPRLIVKEIKDLENDVPLLHGTKPPSQFQNEPLKGLWHKHFFSGQFVGKNMVNEWGGGRIRKLVETIFDPGKSPVVTREMVCKLAYGLTHEMIEKREQDGRLTGEWIVYAKQEDENYYLCIACHDWGDEYIYGQIKSFCFPQFPFLEHSKE